MRSDRPGRRVNGPHQRPGWFPGLWEDGQRGFAEGLIQQLVPRSALPDLGVPVAWGTHFGSIYLG